MSEVSQLSEMNAVLIASKEDNDRKRQEADDMTAKIADLEKRLEEQVAFTNRYRDTKMVVTGGLRKRVETLQDLLLKLDHVAKQTSDVYMPRLSFTSEGVQDHQKGVAAHVPVDLTATFERLSCLVERHNDCTKQEVNTKHASTAHRAKERELIELTTRIGELEAQCKTQDEGSAAAQASRNAFLKAIEALRTERSDLEERLETAGSSLEQNTLQMKDIQAEIGSVESAREEDMAKSTSQQESIAAETEALKNRLADLSGDVSRQETVHHLDKEESRLTQELRALSAELEEVKGQNTRDDPSVIEMKAQLQEKTQRHQLLTEQLATSEKVIAAHTINDPEFSERKAEHQSLMSKIGSIRSTQATSAVHKAALEEETRVIREKTTAAAATIEREISSANKESVRIVAERKEAADTLAAIELAIAEVRTELSSLRGQSEEISSALRRLSELEQDLTSQCGAQASNHTRVIAQCQAMAKEHQAEIKGIEKGVEDLVEELTKTKAGATAEQEMRLAAANDKLFAEVVANKTGTMTATIEAAHAEELRLVEEEILSEDTRLRAACTDANQGPPCGGPEERLRTEVSDLLAQKATMEFEVSAAESRVQRLKDRASRQDDTQL
eukprot:jgi/Undpi1/10272/HiC_scaffold_28.g12724.m1